MKLKKLFFYILYMFLLYTINGHYVVGASTCQNIFSSDNLAKSDTKDITSSDLKFSIDSFIQKMTQTFIQKMTQNLLLHENQVDLLRFYILRSFSSGELITVLDPRLFVTLFDTLKRYPHLSKPMVREQIISFYDIQPNKDRSVPKELIDSISSFKKTSSQLRNNLFQIEANYGFWIKLLNFPLLELESTLNKKEQQLQKQEYKNQFISYLDTTALNKDTREIIKNPDLGYKDRTFILYKALNEIKQLVLSKTDDSESLKTAQKISQAMAELIHTSGFGNQNLVKLLNNNSYEDKVQAVDKILNEREAMAQELGFGFTDFLTLKTHLKANIANVEDKLKMSKDIHKEVIYSENELTTYRLRSLSIQESPFRSCLSGDCASRTYFGKALDPNYLYFTLTDKNNKSSGHVTVVLGESENHKSIKVRTAFIDKIQAVAEEHLSAMLEGIRLSLKEIGYELALPVDIGSVNGLSNQEGIQNSIKKILPTLQNKLENFTPHYHDYVFPDGFSRAHARLTLLRVEHLNVKDAKIQKGELFDVYYDETFSKSDLESLVSLRYSEKETDQREFVKSLFVLIDIPGTQILITESDAINHLYNIIRNTNFSFLFRKQVFFQFIQFIESHNMDSIILPDYGLMEYDDIHSVIFLKQVTLSFSEKEIHSIIGEMSNWKTSLGYREDFVNQLKKSKTSHYDFNKMKALVKSQWYPLLGKDDIEYMRNVRFNRVLKSSDVKSRL